MRSRSNGGVIGAYALPNQNRANGVFFIHDAAIFNTGLNPIWPLAAGLIYSATGGTITNAVDNNNYKLHTFTANGTFAVVTGSAFVDIFLVGGGGSGGGAYHSLSNITIGSGGGCGGVVTLAQQVWVNSGTTFTVEVGQGGAETLSGISAALNRGKPSRVTSGAGYSFISPGGGYGGGTSQGNYYAPSSGGGYYNESVTQTNANGGAAPAVGTGSVGTITSTTFAGGAVTGLGSGTGRMLGGGGAGATEAGFNNNYATDPALAGNGGDGYYYSRTGYYYGSGGGGGKLGSTWNNAYQYLVGRGGLCYDGTGYANGGGAYTNSTSSRGANSPNGFGGGGGGAAVNNDSNTANPGGAGGNGTVIFCYRYR